MGNDEQSIMVVARDALFAPGYFTGFAPASAADYETLVLEHAAYMRRGDAEHDPRVKQPIAYTIVCHRPSARVFAYQRATEAGRYDETRLRGKWSWGVGGHIDRADGAAANPIRASMERELAEEIRVGGPIAARVLGYINDDATDVGTVHFGILYLAELAVPDASPRDPEIARGRLHTLAELDAIMRARDATVEDWSRIAWGPLATALAGAPRG